MTEQPMGGGAAFWAARGVRIEPEVADEEEFEAAEPEFEQAADVAEPEQIADAEPEQPEAVVVEVEVADIIAEDPETPEEAEDVEAADVVDEIEVDVEPEIEVAVIEPEVEPEVAVEPEIGRVPEPEVLAEESAQPPVEAVPEPRAAEETTLPGFPQQRTQESSPAAVAAEDAAQDAPDEAEEPAWQLSGDLASPLPPLKTCIEAILMVVDEPVSVVLLAQVLERPTAEVAEALKELAEEYNVLGRGFELREVGLGSEGDRTGWRVYSRAECAAVVERFVRDGQQAKLTQAALETLAVVAYRQPVSRSKVSAIRGVNCDGVMRTLLARGLVEEYGNDHETGAILYQTTGYFLERMGLKTLDELPDLAPLLPSAADVDVEDFA